MARLLACSPKTVCVWAASGLLASVRLRRYAELAVVEDVPRILLFTFPSDRREAEARRALSAGRLTVATAPIDLAMADPLGSVWWPPREPFRRPLLQVGWDNRQHAGAPK